MGELEITAKYRLQNLTQDLMHLLNEKGITLDAGEVKQINILLEKLEFELEEADTRFIGNIEKWNQTLEKISDPFLRKQMQESKQGIIENHYKACDDIQKRFIAFAIYNLGRRHDI